MMRGMLGTFAKAFEDPETYLAKQATDSTSANFFAESTSLPSVQYLARLSLEAWLHTQLDKFEQERREIYIYDLAVDAEFRAAV